MFKFFFFYLCFILHNNVIDLFRRSREYMQLQSFSMDCRIVTLFLTFALYIYFIFIKLLLG